MHRRIGEGTMCLLACFYLAGAACAGVSSDHGYWWFWVPSAVLLWLSCVLQGVGDDDAGCLTVCLLVIGTAWLLVSGLNPTMGLWGKVICVATIGVLAVSFIPFTCWIADALDWQLCGRAGLVYSCCDSCGHSGWYRREPRNYCFGCRKTTTKSSLTFREWHHRPPESG